MQLGAAATADDVPELDSAAEDLGRQCDLERRGRVRGDLGREARPLAGAGGARGKSFPFWLPKPWSTHSHASVAGAATGPGDVHHACTSSPACDECTSGTAETLAPSASGRSVAPVTCSSWPPPPPTACRSSTSPPNGSTTLSGAGVCAATSGVRHVLAAVAADAHEEPPLLAAEPLVDPLARERRAALAGRPGPPRLHVVAHMRRVHVGQRDGAAAVAVGRAAARRVESTPALTSSASSPHTASHSSCFAP